MWVRHVSRSFWLRAGMSSLILGMLSLRFAARIPGISANQADAVSGFFYGVAIASLLAGLRAKRAAE
ncbi:MAG TPA: hypothetical protein VMJ70_14060 [Candidatus Sulfotelmatobacter sp.]|nr:hypothetical protein [Candidatus Sulfotelmatobacter sp.]